MFQSEELKTLGMDRRIPRRDFLNGVAIGAGATLAALRFPQCRRSPERGCRQRCASIRRPAPGCAATIPAAIEHFRTHRAGDYRVFPARCRHRRRLRPRDRRRRHLGPRGRLLLAPRAGRRSARPDSRQPRRLRRTRQAQRVHLRRPHLHRLRRHDEHLDAVSATATPRRRSSPSSASRSRRNSEFLHRGLFDTYHSARRRSSTRSTSARIASSPARAAPWEQFFARGAAHRRTRVATDRGSTRQESRTTWRA